MTKIIKIKVIPRSSKNEIVETLPGGALRIKLKAPPVDGRANEALIEFLSEKWNVAKNKIRIVKGLKSKNKIIEINNEMKK